MADEDKRRSDFAERLINLLLALVVTVIAIVVAWHLASADFAPAPVLSNPGTIFVAAQSGSRTSGAPIKISVNYNAVIGTRSTAFTMDLTQVLPGQSIKQNSPKVILMLCGTIARHPRFVDNRLRSIQWHHLVLPPGESNSLVRAGSECVYTVVSLTSESLESQFFQATVHGSSGTAASRVSGDRILYALHGVAVWPPTIPMESFRAGLLPRGSALELDLSGFPSDLENVTASPQLPNSGILQWAGRLNPVPAMPVYQYRLGGQLTDREAATQRELFISGAFVGVAGAGVIWFLEQLVGSLISIRRRKRGSSNRARANKDEVAVLSPDHRPEDGAEPNHREPTPDAAEQDNDPARIMLERLKARSHTPSLQAIYDGLRKLGYIPHVPQVRTPGKQPELYLRWTDPARGGPAVIYFDALNFWFVRKEDLEALGDLPSGQITLGGRNHSVKFTIGAESTEQILQGAQHIKR